jgi:hypothetical protein
MALGLLTAIANTGSGFYLNKKKIQLNSELPMSLIV